MSSEFLYYVLVILAAVLGFLVLKKVTSCMIKTLVALVCAAVLAAIYFIYLRQ